MLYLKKKLEEPIITGRPVVLYFFFKKGDEDIQSVRTALQSMLSQLLDREQIRNDTSMLRKCVEILNPAFGKSAEETSKIKVSQLEPDFNDIGYLCETIYLVGRLFPRLYVLVDALDECQDRQEKNFVHLLKSMVRSDGGEIRLVLSIRDTVNLKPELDIPPDPRNNPSLSEEAMLSQPWTSFILITPEKNASDLRSYLTHDISNLLDRRIDRKVYASYYKQELKRIVSIMQKKTNGDFALARIILANLQQPSKLSLDDKIKRLPAAIGEIYMSALEALKADEQELVVATLKWIVWSVSTLTVIEISDHYRELYRNTDDKSWDARPLKGTHTSPDDNLIELPGRPQVKDEIDEPEVKEMIYHLETIGRDFFRLERHTGLVTVDVSIREWIREDSKTPSVVASKKQRGFNRYKDEAGYTVLKITLTRK
ncbi:hypothetical protein ABW20_dc0101393 [Dactylellina cionopaga]|nr:hypothetical protein ABW20_dc0101393 [Dactylellina cionopaga]